eukprot:384092_1
MNHLHPIQLNFGGYINNETLSDIKLKGNITNRSQIMNIDDDIDDNKDDNKFDESNMSLISSLDDNEQSTDSEETNSNDIHHSKDGIIYSHWDIIRSRCVVFDLIFYAMIENKTDLLPMDKIYIHRNTNTIHFDVSYDALLIVIKYIYTGVTRRYDYDDIRTARDVIDLANILHLKQLSIDINGQFLNSRKRLKDNMENNKLNNIINIKQLKKWKTLMELKQFDVSKWNINEKYFLNVNVLYELNYKMYKYMNSNIGFNSRQLIKINNKIFEISKIIFACVSEYFNALFCKEFAKNDEIEMNEINCNHFEKLQRFLYTFDQSVYFNGKNGKLNDLDFNAETSDKMSIIKKELLSDCICAFHLSIFFGIADLRQCLIFIIDKYYLCNNTLYGFWKLGFEFELKDIKELCINYFSNNFGDISVNVSIFNSLTKDMIKSGLSAGKIEVSTDYMINILLNWASFHNKSIQELLPPNTLFNKANKSYVLANRRPINLQHLLRL